LKVVLFGDSLSDDGSGVYTFSGHFLPLPPYYQGRFSNGHIWLEYVAQKVHLDYKHFFDYAYGGAFVDAENPSMVPSLMATVNDYLISQKFNISSYDADKTLYIIFGGGNDVRKAVFFGEINESLSLNLRETLPYIVNFITQRIVDAGGKHIVVFELIPLNGPLIENITLDQREELQNLTLDLNNLIAEQIANLRSSSGVNITLYDPYDFWFDAVNNPEQFGFRNSTGYCFQNYIDFIDGSATTGEQANVCENPQNYLFWDGLGHPTTKFHEAFAGDIVKTLGWN